ncbi:MAG: hypothetical protein HYX53_15330 [Chloroflexi bacterium]|nr:hypothetical protein [Chloroflexota bacterium]
MATALTNPAPPAPDYPEEQHMSRVNVLVGTRKGAFIYTSDARRESWEISEPMMPGWTINHMAVDLRRGTPRFYAGANHWAWGPSVARSDDGGATWEQRSPGLAFPQDMGLNIAAVWHVEPGHAKEPGVVYAGTAPAALFKSVDYGDSWEPVEAITRHKLRHLWGPTGSVGDSSLHSIQVDPRDPQRLYISISSGGTYLTENGGEDWDLRSHGVVVTTPAAKEILAMIVENFPQPELPPDVDPAAIDEFHKLLLDPKNPDRLWGQAHFGVFKSERSGKDWQDVTEGLPSFHGFPLAITRRAPDAVFVLPLEHQRDNFRVQPGQLAVWRTCDGGKTWEACTNGLPGPHDYQSAYREALSTDGCEDEGVYLGTTNGEVYYGAERGERWQRLPGTLPPILSVTAVEIP